MTIRGFRSLLDRDKEIYTKKISLRDTKLIVDGDNFIIEFLSFLNEDEQKPYYRSKLYSSDLVSYGKALVKVCEKFKKCNIEPIFIFCGAIPNIQLVQPPYPIRIDNMSRTKNCLRNVTMDLDECKSAGSSAYCILLKAVSKTLIDDMGFERRRTPFLCDKYICNLSLEMKCPILSSDSDFILLDSYEGFIMNNEIIASELIETFDEDGKTTGYSIECDIYAKDKLLENFPGLKNEMIPLFGAMLDSSYLEPHITEMMLRPFWDAPRNRAEGDQIITKGRSNTKPYSPAQKRILNVFNFLAEFDNPLAALKSIISKVDREQLANLREPDIYGKVIDILDVWSIEDTSFDDATRFLRRFYPDCNQEIHDFIMDVIHNDNMSSKFVNILFKTTQFERPYIERLRWGSPNVLKKRIYSIMLALTRPKSITKMTDEEKKIAEKRDVCKIYDRICNRQLVFLSSIPMSKLTDDINLDDYDINRFKDLKNDEALGILLGAFYCNKDNWIELNKLTDTLFKDTFSYNGAICLLMLKYVAIGSKMNIKNLIDGVLLTLIYHAIEQDELLIDEKIYDKHDLLDSLNDSQNQIEDPVASNNFPGVFYETTHMIALFNVALWAFINLNSVIKSPMGVPRPELFMNGRMIYMFYRLSSDVSELSLNLYPDCLKERVECIKEKLIEFIPDIKRRVIKPMKVHSFDTTTTTTTTAKTATTSTLETNTKDSDNLKKELDVTIDRS